MTSPLVEDLPNGDLIELIPLSVVMVLAVLAVGGRRRSLIIALVLLIPALAAKWLDYLSPDLVSPAGFAAFGVVFFGYVVAELIRFILRAPRVDTNVLCAGVSGFLMLGLAWAPLYLLISRLNPAAFHLPIGAAMDDFNALYFSFVSLCTVGYGDITPVSRGAKMVAVLEAITGLFYMAILISRLVSVYSSHPPEAQSKPSNKS
ncbi:MAG TPA: potassium channel family protein [Verrucomicrobiae bacterium]|nr:potassium channel family protein [Verrucomicrobiae bacterium]